jgi:DegV family protein with EDD domain
MVKIITDSSADLPKEFIDKYNISVVPLTITLNGKDYLESIDITSEEFFKRMFVSEELPKTSQPSPAQFGEVFKKMPKDEDAICLTISSGLSGSYQSACVGKDISGTNVHVFDTLAGSLAHGLMVIKAAELSAAGQTLDEIIEKLKECRKNMNILILLNTLENIVKGGRLSKFKGSIAKILDIKVLLEGIDGKVVELEKVRGKKAFLKRVLDVIEKRRGNFKDTIFGITHTGNIADAEFLKSQIIERFKPKNVIINYMGATMGTYAGKDGMIVSFY